jgi:orotate phosphoribosyltransferase
VDSNERLVALVNELSVRWGNFTLASGKQSDFYVDARLTSLHPEGLTRIATAILERLAPEVVAIGGPVTGADPIVGAVVAASHGTAQPLCGFMVRKQPKGHGTRQWVEGLGNLTAGAAVCFIEDTVTTGGSLLKAIRHAEEAGLQVVQCLVVVDREEGGAERIRGAGYPFEALVTRSDLER